MKISKALLAGFCVALLWTLTAWAAPGAHEHVLKTGKEGEFTLTQPTKVGNELLRPDTYVIQHRTSKHANHFVRFLESKEIEDWTQEGSQTDMEEADVGEIPCRVEPAAGRIKQTRVYTVLDNGVPRITKVAIKGENVVHVF